MSRKKNVLGQKLFYQGKKKSQIMGILCFFNDNGDECINNN